MLLKHPMRHATRPTPSIDAELRLLFRVYEESGRPLGTFSLQRLREQVARGDIPASCLIVPQGRALWYPLTALCASRIVGLP